VNFSLKRLRGDRTVLALLSAQVGAAFAAMAMNLAAPWVMSASDRGILALVLQLGNMAATILICGQDSPFVKATQGSFVGQLLRFGRLLWPAGLAAACFGAMVGLFVHSWAPRHLVLAVVGVAYVVMSLLSRGVAVALISSREWRPYGLHLIVTYGLFVAGVGALVLLRIGLVSAWLGLYLFGAVMPLIYLVVGLRKGERGDVDRNVARTVRRQGVRLLPGSLGNTAMLRADRLLLPAFAPMDQLGQYTTVSTLMEIATWPIKQWADSSLRQWALAGESLRQRAPLMFARAIGAVALLSALIGGAGYLCLSFLFPSGYRGGVVAILPLGLASLFYATSRVAEGLLIALDAPGSVSIAEGVGMAIAVLAYFALIPSFGIAGAAWGSVVGYLAGAVVALLLLRARFHRG